jgi:hypothetical protein
MTINPIGAANPNQAIDPTTFQTQMQQALAPVAQLFGESTDQLMSELGSANTSLSALASQKGVSQSDLVGAIKQGLQQTAAEKGQSPSDAQLTNIANRIANHKHGGHHHHGGGGGASTTSATTNSIPTDSTQALLTLLGAQDPSNVDQAL